MTVKYVDAKRIQGLSSDTKPTNVPAGSIYVETDTYYYSWYDGTTWTSQGRGVFAGGLDSNVMDYITIPNAGDASDFGDLTPTSNYGAMGGGNGTRGVICNGNEPSIGDSDRIEYITIATAADADDFGDLSVARHAGAGMDNGTRTVFSSGNGSNPFEDTIDYIVVANQATADDFGDAQTGVYGRWGGVSNGTRGMCAGGMASGSTQIKEIDVITIATEGNAGDFGDLIQIGYNGAGGDNKSRGVFVAGIVNNAVSNSMEYITMSNTSGSVTATDFGDRGGSHNMPACACDDTRICIGGGQTVNRIDYITTATESASSDFGELTAARYGLAACDTSRGFT